VDNKPGANSVLAADFTADAQPDGHTIMLSAESLALSPFLVPNLPYRPLEDFAFVTQCGHFNNVILVARDSRYRTLGDLVVAARAVWWPEHRLRRTGARGEAEDPGQPADRAGVIPQRAGPDHRHREWRP
jgi:tripartite-type tricarboxylate transporter receptor subunit TctC